MKVEWTNPLYEAFGVAAGESFVGALVALLDGVDLPRTDSVFEAGVDVAGLIGVVKKRECEARHELGVGFKKLFDFLVGVSSRQTATADDVEARGFQAVAT